MVHYVTFMIDIKACIEKLGKKQKYLIDCADNLFFPEKKS